MQSPRQATRVRIYFCEADRWQGHPLQNALIERLHKAGAAGATLFRGLAGFGVSLRLRSGVTETDIFNMPFVLEWIDTPDRVERLLPEIQEMVTEGIITVEPVTIVKHAYRGLRPIAEDRTVGEVMTKVVATVHPEAPVHELVELLVHRNYRALPVVDRERRIAGIVTNVDLINRGGLGVRAELFHILQAGMLDEELQRLVAAGMTAADVMTRDVVTVREQTGLSSAAHLMASERLKRLPVVDGAGRVIGIVSRVDILRTVEEQYPIEPGTADAEEAREPRAVPLLVEAAMNRSVPSVRADASLPEVLDAVVSTRLNRAVVVDAERRPLGVISDALLMQRIDPAQQPGVVQVLLSRLPFVRLRPEQRETLRSQTGTRAGDLMIAPAVTVHQSTPVIEAIGRMIERSYKILPVIDDDGCLVGMIDRADLLRAIVAE